MGALFRALSTIFFSLLLGAIALALCAIYFPETLEEIQIQADHLRKNILYSLSTHFGTTSSVNVWLRFLLQDQQLVFMGFVIVARVAVFSLLSFLSWLFFDAFRVEKEVLEIESIREERRKLDEARKALEAERKRRENAGSSVKISARVAPDVKPAG